jgi:GMP synthase-like glutamine amidotransferase
MRIHILQHVPFEDDANIGVWAHDKGWQRTRTCFYTHDALPDVEAIDWLVIMGGLMNIYEYDVYPWLIQEKEYIKRAIQHKRFVLGICLGAQLIADCLGSRVTRNPHREIGWHDVTLTEPASQSLLNCLPKRFTAFHWHGDTFSIPPGTLSLGTSRGCVNQAFQYQDHVLAMQFHLDDAHDSIQRMIDNCAHELTPGPYVQTDPAQLLDHNRTESLREYLFTLLDHCYQSTTIARE